MFLSKIKAFAKSVGNFQARILLTLLYFSVFAIFAIPVKLFSDPLGLKPKKETYWVDREVKKLKGVEGARQLW